MTNAELRELAAIGVTRTVAEMERLLAMYHEDWPELFLSSSPPQLLRRPNGAAAPSSRASSWTQARRAAHSQAMKDRAAARRVLAAQAIEAAATKATRVFSAASRRKLALAMKRRHANGTIARAKERAAKERARA